MKKGLITLKTTNFEKIAFAQQLLQQGYKYRDIQEILKKKYKSGMSNSTLTKLQAEMDENQNLKAEIQRLKYELALYKNLYQELLETIKSKNSTD